MIPARLPYKIAEYAPRTLWASPAARSVWEPRIARVSQAWIETERDSVADGIRQSALQTVAPEELPRLMQALAPRGLVALPLAQTSRTQGYQSATRPTRAGDVLDYRVVLTKPEHVAAWADAWARNDDAAQGRLLSTPDCCIEAFDRFWRRERWFDLTVPTHPESIVRAGYNGLLRWLGVRGVPYMPCSPTCEPTLALQERLLACMAERFPVEAAWLREMLSWPTKYSSLYATAEVTTPAFRFCVATDALAEKVDVMYVGSTYPEAAASGLTFPFRRDVPKPAKVLTFVPRPDPAANGFASAEAMRQAHDELLAVLAGRTFERVLDLGCGDGTLLTRIPTKRRIGVESAADRAAKAAKRIDRVVVGDCTDRALVERVLAEEQPDLVIAQAARNSTEAFAGRTVLSYSYEVPRFATLVNT